MKKTILKECMRISLEKMEARAKTSSTAHHFSYIVIDNKIIESGSNRFQDIPIHWGYDTNFQGLHSEMCAYVKAKGLIKNKPFELVNIRLNRSLHMRMSKPCNRCTHMMKSLGCVGVWFSTDDGCDVADSFG